MFSTPEFWVAISFVLFVGLVLYLKAPAMLTRALDARAAAIAKELDEARRLREEAQTLLASYQRRQRDAEKEVADIVREARAEAERLSAETKKTLEAELARRSKAAEEKIARAEAQALAEMRNLTADTAIAAARRLIAETMDEARAKALVDTSIKGLRGKIN